MYSSSQTELLWILSSLTCNKTKKYVTMLSFLTIIIMIKLTYLKFCFSLFNRLIAMTINLHHLFINKLSVLPCMEATVTKKFLLISTWRGNKLQSEQSVFLYFKVFLFS